MIFFDEKLKWIFPEVDVLGFSAKDNIYIPDEYLEQKDFFIFRIPAGLGDWGIISAMPRLLKEKYPDCKISVPSTEFLKRHCDISDWTHWPNPEENPFRIFQNNPYIDKFIDDYKDIPLGGIYHDHFRIYNEANKEIPLVEQMLKYWQFTEDEYKDSQPEIYWTDEEIEKCDKIIKKYFNDKPFGGFIDSNSDEKFNPEQANKLLVRALQSYTDLSFVYYGDLTTFANSAVYIKLNLKDINLTLREQLYIRSKAIVNLGYQSSMFDIIARYTKIICVPISSGVRENKINGIEYL